jgi:S1-C subfamily serine protease
MLIHRLMFFGVSVAALMLVGCSTLTEEQDLANLRNEQRASLQGPGPNTVGGESIRMFMGKRTYLIVPQTAISGTDPTDISFNLDRSGHAAPLTEDGYFLTAAHVVENDLPVAIITGDTRPARVVKVFPQADIALIKFPFRPGRYFEHWLSDVSIGDSVYSATPDEAKGIVKSTDTSTWKDGYRTVECELPARSGMSGSSVANGDGELLGVLIGNYRNRFTGRAGNTVVRMLDPKVIHKVIEIDRRQHKAPDSNTDLQRSHEP